MAQCFTHSNVNPIECIKLTIKMRKFVSMKADESMERKWLINIPGREGKQGLTEEVQLKVGHPSSSSSSSSLIVTVLGNVHDLL